MQRVAVIGAGTMGHGIAQVAAMAGLDTFITDENEPAIRKAREHIRANLDGAITRGRATPADAEAALSRITGVSGIDVAVPLRHTPGSSTQPCPVAWP